MTPTISTLTDGLESLALTILPSPRENAPAILGEFGPRLASFGLRPADSMDRPPIRLGLIEVESALAALATEAGRGPAGLSLNLAKSEVTRMIALLSTGIVGEPPGFADVLGFAAMAAAGHLRRARDGGSAVGCG